MRSINFRFVGISLLCVLLICGAVHAVHVMQFEGHLRFLQTMAQEADESGDESGAIGLYRRYVTLSRTDADAYERLAPLLMDSEQFSQAQSPLNQALRLRKDAGATEKDLGEIRSKLVDVALATRRFSDAQQQLIPLLASDAENLDLLEKRAVAYAGQREWSEAAKELEYIIAQDPGRETAYSSLADIRAERLDESDMAVRCLRELVSRNQDSVLAWLIRGAFRYRYVNHPDDDVRLAEAQFSSGTEAQRATPLTHDQLLELATSDVRRAVELMESQPDADHGGGATADEREAADERHNLQVGCLQMAIACEQQQRHSSDGESIDEQRRTIEEHRQRAIQHAEELIAVCANRFARREAAMTAALRRKVQTEAEEKSEELTDDELADRSKLAERVVRQVRQEAFLPADRAYMTLAAILESEGDRTGAVTTLKEGLERIGDHEMMLWQLGKLYLTAGGDEFEQKAFDDVTDRLAEMRRPKPLADLLRAQRLIRQEKIEEARKQIVGIRGQLDRWPTVLVEADTSLGTCLLMQQRHEEAATTFSRALNANPSAAAARWGLARALEAGGKPDDALREVELLSKNFGNVTSSVIGRQLLIKRFQLEMQRLGRATATDDEWERLRGVIRANREQIAAQASDDSELARLAEELTGLESGILYSRGRQQEALELLAAEAQKSPQSVPLWLTLSEMYDLLGNHGAAEVALSSLQQAVDSPTPDDAASIQVAVARHLVYADGAAAASQLKAMIKARRTVPSDPSERRSHLRSLESLGVLASSVGDSESASEAFEIVSQSDPDNFEVLVRRIDLLLGSTGSPEEESEQQRLNDKLTKLESLINSIEPISPSMEAVKHYGNAVTHIVRAEIKQAAGASREEQAVLAEYGAALERLNGVAKVFPRWGRVAHLQGIVLYNQGDEDGAADAWLRAVRFNYRVPKFVSSLVVLLYQRARFEEATELLTSIRGGQGPQIIQFAQVAADLSTTHPNDGATQEQLLELAVNSAAKTVENSSNPVHHLAYAEILFMRGDPEDLEEAEQSLERVRELAPADRTIWTKLIQLYQQQSQRGQISEDQVRERVRETLAVAETVLSTADISIVASQALWELGNRDEARARLRGELEEVPADLHEANANQIELLSRAVEYFLLDSSGPADEVSQTLGDEILNRLIAEGGQVLQDLQQTRGSDPRSRPSPLEAALAKHVPLSRRRQASLLLVRKGIAGQEDALKLLDANEASGNPDDDARLRAVILSSSMDSGDRIQALDLLKAIVKPAAGKVVRNEDRLLLASLSVAEYERQQMQLDQLRRGSNPDVSKTENLKTTADELLDAALDQTDKIVVDLGATGASRQQADQGYVTALMLHIDILLRKNDQVSARRWLNVLKEVRPGENVTVLTEASVQFAAGKHDAVIKLLMSLISEDEEQPRTAQMSSVAKLLEGMGARAGAMSKDESANVEVQAEAAAKYAEAAAGILESLAEQGPDHQLILAGFYARQGRADEALNLLEAHWEAGSVVALASGASQLMGGAGRSESSMSRLYAILATAYEQHPHEAAIRLLVADLSGWMGKYAEAERLYREVLAESPNHVVAANNLAYLLASQETQLDEALELIDGVINSRGRAPELLDTRAYVLMQRSSARRVAEDASRAIADLDAAIKESRQPAYLYHRARAKLISGDSAAARTDWQEAIQANLSEETLHPAELDEFQSAKTQLNSR